MIVIEFIDNSGEGVPQRLERPDGTTVGDLLNTHYARTNRQSVVTRVNRQEVGDRHILHDGDRVTATPGNTKGG